MKLSWDHSWLHPIVINNKAMPKRHPTQRHQLCQQSHLEYTSTFLLLASWPRNERTHWDSRGPSAILARFAKAAITQLSMLVLVQVDVPYPPKNVQSQHSNAHSAPHRFRPAQQLAAAPQPWVRTPAEAKTLSSSLVAFHPAGSNHDVLLWFIFYF